MPTFTTNRGYNLPIVGAELDIWGGQLNTNFATIDQNFGAVTTVALSSVAVGLSAAQLACGVIRLTGALLNDLQVTWPLGVSGWWTIDNRTTGDFCAVIKGSGGPTFIAPPQGCATDIYFDGTGPTFRNLPAVGTYWDYAGTALPRWVNNCSLAPYLLCDGSAFNGAVYPILAQILGTTALPDLRGRSRFFLNVGTGRITAASGVDGDTRSSGGGVDTVTLALTQVPNHDHAYSGSTSDDGSHSHPYRLDDQTGTQAMAQTSGGNFDSTANTETSGTHHHTYGGTTDAKGGGQLHTNMPPACIGGLPLIRAG